MVCISTNLTHHLYHGLCTSFYTCMCIIVWMITHTKNFFKFINIIMIVRWLQILLYQCILGLHIKKKPNVSSLPQGTLKIKTIVPYESTSLWAIKSTSNLACVGFKNSVSHKWPQNGSFGPSCQILDQLVLAKSCLPSALSFVPCLDSLPCHLCLVLACHQPCPLSTCCLVFMSCAKSCFMLLCPCHHVCTPSHQFSLCH